MICPLIRAEDERIYSNNYLKFVYKFIFNEKVKILIFDGKDKNLECLRT
jgi:hypothetical protein